MKREEVFGLLKRAVEDSIERASALLEDSEFQERFEETAASVLAVVRAEVLAALEPSIRRLIRLIEEERNPHAVIRAIELLVDLGGLRKNEGAQVTVNNANLVGVLAPDDIARLQETVSQLEAYRRGASGVARSGTQ